MYWLARKHLRSERAAGHFAFAYLLFPATQFNALTITSGFHAVSMAVPLILFAIPFVVFAAIDWRRLPVWARVHLAVATAFALAAIAHPGMTIHDVLGQTRDGLAYVVGLARVAGLVAALVSIATRLRELALR